MTIRSRPSCFDLWMVVCLRELIEEPTILLEGGLELVVDAVVLLEVAEEKA